MDRFDWSPYPWQMTDFPNSITVGHRKLIVKTGFWDSTLSIRNMCIWTLLLAISQVGLLLSSYHLWSDKTICSFDLTWCSKMSMSFVVKLKCNPCWMISVVRLTTWPELHGGNRGGSNGKILNMWLDSCVQDKKFVLAHLSGVFGQLSGQRIDKALGLNI